MAIDRPDWGTSSSTAVVPVASTPTLEHDLIEQREAPTEEPATGAGTEDIDPEDVAKLRGMLANGVFTPDELKRAYGLTDAEVERLQKPEAARQSIDEELAAIAQRRRTDRRSYNKDEKMQARERELLEAKAAGASAAKQARQSALEPSDGSALDPVLLQEWTKEGGVAHNLAVAQRAARGAIEALDAAEGDALRQSFDQLPATAQTAIYRFLAVPGGTSRPASDSALQEFGSTEEGAALIKEWGSRAARNVGTVKSRMGLMLQSMSVDDRAKAEEWFDALSSPQAKAVLRALAGR